MRYVTKKDLLELLEGESDDLRIGIRCWGTNDGDSLYFDLESGFSMVGGVKVFFLCSDGLCLTVQGEREMLLGDLDFM